MVICNIVTTNDKTEISHQAIWVDFGYASDVLTRIQIGTCTFISIYKENKIKIKKWNVDEKRNTRNDFSYENLPMGIKFPLRIWINFQIKKALLTVILSLFIHRQAYLELWMDFNLSVAIKSLTSIKRSLLLRQFNFNRNAWQICVDYELKGIYYNI